MHKKKNNKGILFAGLLSLSGYIELVNAELYVSPVMRDTVIYNNYSSPQGNQTSQAMPQLQSHQMAAPNQAENRLSQKVMPPVAHPQMGAPAMAMPSTAPNMRGYNYQQPQMPTAPTLMHQPISSRNYAPTVNQYQHAPLAHQAPMPQQHHYHQQRVNGQLPFISGQSTMSGQFSMQSSPMSNAMKFGNNVPLFIAIENIIPNGRSWMINIDDGLESLPVSWSGGQTWESALKAVEMQNGLSIAINHSEKAVGVGKVADVSIALASRTKQLWRLDSKKTLRENIEHWATLSGWSVHWDEAVSQVNYPVVADASYKGNLHGSNGIIDQLLSATKDIPLAADFYHKNKVIHVRKAGYKVEVDF